MHFATVVAVIFGLCAPLPSAYVAIKFFQKTSETKLDRYGWAGTFFVVISAVMFFCYTVWTLGYLWDWYYAALHSSPVRL